ncbi:transglutaminase domain-containing protein [Breznakiellaceae bacterium SP9]
MKKRTSILLLFVLAGFSLAAQSADVINAAISAGDCATLYSYIQQEKARTDAKLVTAATNALKRYTAQDTTVARYQTNKIDPKVRTVGKSILDMLSVNPALALPEVVDTLTKGSSDTFLKTKQLHDWICDTIAYDTDSYFTGNYLPQDYAAVLKNKKAVAMGYAALFAELCRLAKIDCVVISGTSKGFGYSGSVDSKPNHTWNAVKLNNKWYLVDVTWDAGAVARKTFVKAYSTDYLFLDSRSFLYSHLPLDPAYQFYAPVITAAAFQKEAFIPGKFFRYGLELKTVPNYTMLVTEAGSVELVSRNNNVLLSYELRTKDQKDVDGAAWMQRQGTAYTFYFDVPDTGEYQGLIFARFKNENTMLRQIAIDVFEKEWLPGAQSLLTTKKISAEELALFKALYVKVPENGFYYYIEDMLDAKKAAAFAKVTSLLKVAVNNMDAILSFTVRADARYKGYGAASKKYPMTYTKYKESSATELSGPLQGVLKPGTEQNFSINSRDFKNFAILINGQYTLLEKKPANKFELKFIIPQSAQELVVLGSNDGKEYTGLFKYTIAN